MAALGRVLACAPDEALRLQLLPRLLTLLSPNS